VAIYNADDVGKAKAIRKLLRNDEQEKILDITAEYLRNRSSILEKSVDTDRFYAFNGEHPSHITEGVIEYILLAINTNEMMSKYKGDLERLFGNFIISLEPFVKNGTITIDSIKRAHRQFPCPKPWC